MDTRDRYTGWLTPGGSWSGRTIALIGRAPKLGASYMPGPPRRLRVIVAQRAIVERWTIKRTHPLCCFVRDLAVEALALRGVNKEQA